MTGERDLDLVLFGATGFVGRLTAAYLAGHAPQGLRVGLAGRSAQRLADLRENLGEPAARWALVEVDATDASAVGDLAASTRVVATTVGPYLRYGRPLVEACARAGTGYADLTGETLFVRDAADAVHDLAAATGARITHACGFDSIPSDLGVLLAHEQALADGAGDLTDTVLRLVSSKGGFSGGTIDSVRAMVEAVKADRSRLRVMRDPYALSPDRSAEPEPGDGRDPIRPMRDPQLGVWVAPFVMGPFNTRIVRRSNALQDWAYGRGFRYREVMGVGRGPAAPVKAAAITTGIGAAVAAMALPPTRMLLDRVLPAPGEGPDEQERRAGHFLIDVHARTSAGGQVKVTVSAHGDPGYSATALMFAETAMCLALDADRLPDRAGVLTPATALGMPLVERLREAGMQLTAHSAG